MIDFLKTSPRPWRLQPAERILPADHGIKSVYLEIVDVNGDLVCGVWDSRGFQGGLLDRHNAELIIHRVNNPGPL